MPYLMVVTDDGKELHRERVDPAHIETELSKAQIMERIRWAVEDARALRQTENDRK